MDQTPAVPVEIRICDARAAVPIVVAVFAGATAFDERAPATASLSLTPAADGTATAAVDLPPGRYAIAAFQDEDGDGRLTTNFLGLPQEPFGFSGAGGRFGPPDFDTAAFPVPAPAPVLVCLRTL